MSTDRVDTPKRHDNFRKVYLYFYIHTYNICMECVLAGHNCETNVDACVPNPCRNGECVDLIDGYRCICNLPFTGPNCSTQLTPCSRHQCRNGAQCIPEPHYTDYTCRCPPGYSGGYTCIFQPIIGLYSCIRGYKFNGALSQISSSDWWLTKACTHLNTH